MTRFRVVLDVDWDDAAITSDHVSDWLNRAMDDAGRGTITGPDYAAIDELEDMGT